MRQENHSAFPVILACAFAAFISAGVFFSIPVPGFPPIVLQNGIVLFSALMLGYFHGPLSVLIFVAIGALGLPVFALGKGGLGHLMGPTGGYIAGYLAGSVVSGFLGNLAAKSKPLFVRIALYGLASAAFLVIVYAIGVWRLKYVLKLDWPLAIARGAVPYLIPDLAKAFVFSGLALKFRPMLDEMTMGKNA